MTSPSSVCIGHVADLHLGTGYVHGDEDRGGVNSRLVDFRQAWIRICERFARERVDLVLFAGDAFRDCRPTPTEQAAFRAGLDVLADAGIPVVAVTGNHDLPRAVGRTHALAIFDGYRDLVRVFDRPAVFFSHNYDTDVPIPVACLPYPSRAHVAARDPDFERLSLDEQNARLVELSLQVLRLLAAEAEDVAGPLGAVLLAHGTIAGSQIGAAQSTQFLREPVLPAAELTALPFRYQAWGHLHRAQTISPHIRYAGSIERCDFAEADEDKGAWIVTLSRNDIRVDWASSLPRPFVDLDLGTEPEKSTAALSVDVTGAVVRVRYTATPELAKTIDHGAIRRALLAAGAVKVHGPFAEIVRPTAETRTTLTEETGVLEAWRTWAALHGLQSSDFDRLDQRVREALEVTHEWAHLPS